MLSRPGRRRTTALLQVRSTRPLCSPSDLGLPELARQWCHQATAYLNQYPLSGMDAIRGLEPLVNLARLDIRASLQIGEYAPDLIDQVGHITNGDVPEDVKIDLEITVYHAIAGRDDLPPGH